MRIRQFVTKWKYLRAVQSSCWIIIFIMIYQEEYTYEQSKDSRHIWWNKIQKIQTKMYNFFLNFSIEFHIDWFWGLMNQSWWVSRSRRDGILNNLISSPWRIFSFQKARGGLWHPTQIIEITSDRRHTNRANPSLGRCPKT